MAFRHRCPFDESALQWAFKLGIIGFGSVGLYSFGPLAAALYLAYSSAFYFLAMPLRHCRYCYYAVADGGGVRGMTVEEWRGSHLAKHVDCGKRWGANLFVLWLAPIALMVASFFLDFTALSLVCLVGFVATLAAMAVDMKRRVCPTCAIRGECHASF